MKRIMKKIFILIMFVVLVFFLIMTLSGCNYKVVDLKYNYTRVHIIEQNKCYTISNWCDYDDGDEVQVKIDGYGYCIFHYNQVVLIENKCPFCDHYDEE